MVGGYFGFVENKTTEFEREYVEDIKNTIVAFANCDGGTLYFPATDTAILNMIKDTSGDSYEAVRSLDQHLTFNKAVDFLVNGK